MRNKTEKEVFIWEKTTMITKMKRKACTVLWRGCRISDRELFALGAGDGWEGVG